MHNFAVQIILILVFLLSILLENAFIYIFKLSRGFVAKPELCVGNCAAIYKLRHE